MVIYMEPLGKNRNALEMLVSIQACARNASRQSQSLNPKPQTLNPESQTLIPKSQSLTLSPEA